MPDDYIISTLQDTELLDEVQGYISGIHASATRKATEATVAFQIDNAIYNTARHINFDYLPEKEAGIQFRRKMKRGRMDSRIGAVVLEYKRPARFHTAKLIEAATLQIEEYMESLVQETDSSVCGFVTDGNQYREIRLAPNESPVRSDVLPLDRGALIRIVQTLASLDLTALTSENLIKDFCGSNKDGFLIQLARILNRKLTENSTPKTIMLRSEWEELFRLGHDDRSQQKRIEDRRKALSSLFGLRLSAVSDEYLALFALHTAYAVVVKFIAYRVVSDLRFRQSLKGFGAMGRASLTALQVFCAKLEDGEVFRQLKIMNLLEGDFFSWYCDALQWDEEIDTAVRRVLETLSRYENTTSVFASSQALDLFRELYEATVPQAVRSSFGEFYTPTWLAQSVLDSAQVPKGGRILDPCSGSGTFLVVAIRRLREEMAGLPNDQILKNILHRVVGLDLNPLAVLTARVNYFIHIADLIPDYQELLTLPVYLGDSCSLPERVTIQEVPCLKVTLKTLQYPVSVTMPIAFVEQHVKFVGTMLEYEKAIQKGHDKAALSVLTAALDEELTTPLITLLLEKFTTSIADLEAKSV